MGVFMIGLPKKNDLYFKGPIMDNFGFLKFCIIIVIVDFCMPIDNMMSC